MEAAKVHLVDAGEATRATPTEEQHPRGGQLPATAHKVIRTHETAAGHFGRAGREGSIYVFLSLGVFLILRLLLRFLFTGHRETVSHSNAGDSRHFVGA